MARVLIVEDEHILAKNLKAKLRTAGHDVLVVHRGEDALNAGVKAAADVVLLDVRLPDVDGLTLLPRLRAQSPSTHVVVMTAHGNERLAVEAMKAGAFEYLTKPVDLDELLLIVQRAVDHQQMSDNLTFLRREEEKRSGLDCIVGQSLAITAVKDTVRKLARADVIGVPHAPTVLITGETGVGKDLVARALHYEGPRRDRPFIHVNCTALPSTLFESELFGHVSGAFTSAAQSKRGLFDVAHGGTIFLDEIGDLSADMQAKLLQAIETREIRPVGGTENRSVNVHVIAATNRDLAAAVAAGEFRRDLYHRLRVIEIRVPPLRERRDDIPALTEHFLMTHARRFGISAKRLDRDALDVCRRHDWRGNVRELSHVIESAVLQVDVPEIAAGDLRLVSETPEAGRLSVEVPDGPAIVVDFAHGTTRLEDVELAILRAAYDYWDHNLSRAARSLGITREALRYRLNKHGQPQEQAAS